MSKSSWSPSRRASYMRIARRRIRQMRAAGGFLRIASYVLAHREIFDPVCWDYLQRIHIEVDLCGPRSIIGCSLVAMEGK